MVIKQILVWLILALIASGVIPAPKQDNDIDTDFAKQEPPPIRVIHEQLGGINFVEFHNCVLLGEVVRCK